MLALQQHRPIHTAINQQSMFSHFSHGNAPAFHVKRGVGYYRAAPA